MATTEQTDHWVRIETGELRAVFGGNDSDSPGSPWSYKGDPPLPAGLRHQPGYNGVWSLTSVPARAAWKEGWLNRDPDFPLALPWFFGRPTVTPGDKDMVFMVMLDTDGVPGFAQPARKPLEPVQLRRWSS